MDRQNHPKLSDDLELKTSFQHVHNGDIGLLSCGLDIGPHCCPLCDRFGATLLHWAARFDNMDAIAALLAAGADANVTSLDGGSTLICAVHS